MTGAPVAITCGEPAGIGPEIAAKAWAALRREIPMVWIGDPRHLPPDTPISEVQDLQAAVTVTPDALPVLRHDFALPAVPGTATPENAQGVIDVIARGVDLVTCGAAAA
ncbi:MAG: 4-hydroxythreonine-4-phosphate dehydrogenase, partial [Pseudomonadota bacterium]